MKRLLPQAEVNGLVSLLMFEFMVGDHSDANSLKRTSVLVLDKVSFAWPCGHKALDQCSFSIPGPGLWMIVGKNGSGKSTLFRLISGMIDAQRGQIFCDVKSSLVFQNPDHQLLLPSCGSDLLLGLPENLSYEERWQNIRLALEQVGLAGMESRPIHTLSGGQKQRLAIAGALASQASLLLLDEPTALLDPVSQKTVLETVNKLCHSSSNPITSLWITHRLEELEYCDGAARMERGKIGSWKSGHQLRNELKPLAVRRG